MRICHIGLNHKTAPVELRERLAVAETDLERDRRRPAEERRKVETADDYRTWSRINNAGFGSNFPCDDAEVRMALSDTSRPLYTAHENGTPLASACLWAPEDRTFCGLQGGAVLAEARGRGLYRDLTLHRLHLARALGYRYAAVDANANSGPRLEGMGFAPVTGETTWTLDMPA